MKDITIGLEDGLYEQSRVIAAQRKTTVTGLVRQYLESLSDAAERRERAREEILNMIGTFDCKIGRMPSREARNARRNHAVRIVVPGLPGGLRKIHHARSEWRDRHSWANLCF
ncbi:MAG TPA: hypothetical protein VN829_17995 [Dongiaceae bacterium]|nr:hypothetical protein [Dongiaceae bacterium]